MIASIRLVNFKNFEDETLHLGPFSVLVGANASGKSNIRDAFRFLHGIGRGYTLAEIIGGKYGAGGQVEWEPMRGATNEIIRFGESKFSFEIKMKLNNDDVYYFIEISEFITDAKKSKEFRIEKEILTTPQIWYEAEFDPSYDEDEKKLTIRIEELKNNEDNTKLIINTRPDQPFVSRAIQAILYYEMKQFELHIKNEQTKQKKKKSKEISNVNTIHRPRNFEYIINIREIVSALARIQFLDLSPTRMREPAFSGQFRLGDRGENLPVILEDICTDTKRKAILTEWISELTPMDVVDLEFERDPSGRVHLMICEVRGTRVSAYSASDGTLRFLAMLAVLINDNPMGLYFFEEIDNGIHPARQWLLLDLIERQVKKTKIQVVTTTHSPVLLSYANDQTFEHISVVSRLENSEDAIIRRVADLPNARNLRTSQGMDRLLTGGWMENMLAFSENKHEIEEVKK